LTEGKEKYAATPDDATGFVFAFKHRGTSYWRDAAEEVPRPTIHAAMPTSVNYTTHE